ncbi:MAG: hypothetical protein MJK12_19815 [Colwellia sp.]|nr:hypothetical protein [Colwellia sp.]
MDNLPEERRQTKDLWLYLMRGLAIIGWLLFIVAFGVAYYAAPEDQYGMYRYHGIEVRKFWLVPLTGYLYIVLWSSALSSYLCLFLDKYRSRRKSDNKHFNLILLMLISIAWISYILIDVQG